MKKLLLSFLICLPFLSNAQLLINEVASNNSEYLLDEDFESPDWIEIYNAGATTVNVGGYGITDKMSMWNQWLLPSIDIAAGQRKLIFASGKNRDCFACGGVVNQMHTNFSLSTGETVALYNASGFLLDSVTIPDLHAGHVRTRIGDGGPWCYSDDPTPNMPNGGTCYDGYAGQPTIVTAPGFYTGSVSVALSGTNVHYTTDGNWPTAASPLYSAPFDITANAVVKAVQVEAGKLDSRSVTGSYFINETTTLPVVSLSGRPCDFFNEAPCYIGAYDNAYGWEPDNIQVPSTVEFFDAAHTQKITHDIKFEVAGNSSIAVYPQRSLQFTCDEDFNSPSGEMDYNIFYQDKPSIDSLQAFRLRSNLDWGNSDARMKDVIVNRLAMPTHSTAAAYQNVAAFINGDYWGHYSAREELDKYYLRNNYGCDPDKVVIIKSGAGEDVWDIAEAGSITEYTDLSNFFNTHNMTNAADYALALDQIDMENWVDYWCVQVFVNNDETAYNIRLFKSYDPVMKWHMLLWDCGAGSEGETVNSLTTVLQFVYTSDEVNMINDLLQNPDFKNYFINRYADLLNTRFQYSEVEPLIDADKAEIEVEIPAQHTRWGFPTTAGFTTAVNQLKGFYDNRVFYQRNDIENHFGMTDQVNVTLEVNPPGSGFVKISTITPETLPWTGVYFDGNPVTVTAIPKPGYTFVDWDANAFITDVTTNSFNNNISDNTTFTANFTGTDLGNSIIISEVNYNSDSTRNSGDWVELHNIADVAVNVTDYGFSNKQFFNDFHIPNNTEIPAHGYLVIAENKEQFLTQHPDITNVIGDFSFHLQNDGDSLTLVDMHGYALSTFKFGDTRPWPYTADGYGRTMELKYDLANPVLPTSWIDGCMGGSPGEAHTLCYENPLVDEINYNSSPAADAGDWFELYNYNTSDIDLSGWEIRDGDNNSFIIPTGTILPASGYRVFYQDEAKFLSRFPTAINATGPLNFGFGSTNDIILLFDPTGTLYQSVAYDNVAPYPLSPDGGGTALQIVNAALDLNDATNWTESCPEGSPGSEFLQPCANAVENQEVISNITVYPNPASGQLHLLVPAHFTGTATITIYDLTGKQLLSETLDLMSNTSINISQLPQGIYEMQMIAEGARWEGRFVKE